MSGSPIFNLAGHIVGLFVKIPENLSGNSVWVLSAISILKDEKFNRLLVPEQKSPRYLAIKNLLGTKEFGDTAFRLFLVTAFDADCQSSETGRIVEAISIQEMQDCLLSLYRQTKKAIENKETINLAQVIAFCNCLLPRYINLQDDITILDNLQRNAGEKWYKHPAATREGAESNMARYDNRPGNQQMINSDSDSFAQNIKSLQAVNSIQLPISAGGEIDPSTGLNKSEKHFYFQFAGSRTREQVYKLLQDNKPNVRSNKMDLEQAKKRLRDSCTKRLKYFTEEEQQTQYYVHNPESDNSLMELLASECSYFLLLQLNDDLDKIEQEEACYLSLLSLYKLKQENE